MEIEVKLRLPSPQAHQRVADLLAPHHVAQQLQRNVFFDGRHGELARRRAVLRLRFYGADDGRCVASLKGEAAIAGGISRAAEQEEEVSDVAMARACVADPSKLSPPPPPPPPPPSAASPPSPSPSSPSSASSAASSASASVADPDPPKLSAASASASASSASADSSPPFLDCALIRKASQEFGVREFVCLGGFRNVRNVYHWEGLKIELDETRFDFGTAYEIECETSDPEGARSVLEAFLNRHAIPFSYSSASKFAVFRSGSLPPPIDP